jgi:putative heme iron utilization protein
MSATPMALDAARMLQGNRWAALATIGEDGPSASMVAYAAASDLSSLLLFLSGLSEHTRNLVAEPRVSLVISEPDQGSDDPQTLARLSVKGTARHIDRTDPGFEEAWRIYLDRLPSAAPRIMLADFSLFRVELTSVRYVGGFAQAGTIPLDRLSAAAGDREL